MCLPFRQWSESVPGCDRPLWLWPKATLCLCVKSGNLDAMKTIYCLLTTLALVSPLHAAPGLPTTKPADEKVSSRTLQKGVQLFRDALKRDEIRGVVLLVARNGKVILHHPLGWANKRKKLPMTKTTLFRMASNTKASVAAAVLQLAEQGKLSLDDPIGKHVPAFRNDKYQKVKIKHLLSHTSGLRIKTLFLRPLMKASKKYPEAPTLQLEVNRFAAIAPEKKPGTTYSYNNPGYNTLGALVEVVSGRPLEGYLMQSIYEPLGMKDTSNHPVPGKFDRMCVVYARSAKTGKWRVRFRQNSGMRVPFVRASGGMVSSALDYARFCQMFLNDGTFAGRRVLSKESVKQMTSPQTRPIYTKAQAKKRKSFYGYGWVVLKDGSFSHSGSEGTYGWIDPNRKLIALVLTQSPGGKIPRQQFVRIVKKACRD